MTQRPSSPIHLHIGRLVIDADVVGGKAVPRDLTAQLHAALAPLLGGAEVHEEPTGRARPSWVDAVASQVAGELSPTLPSSASSPAVAPPALPRGSQQGRA